VGIGFVRPVYDSEYWKTRRTAGARSRSSGSAAVPARSTSRSPARTAILVTPNALLERLAALRIEHELIETTRTVSAT